MRQPPPPSLCAPAAQPHLLQRPPLACISKALAFIYDKDLVKNLFEQAPKRYAERQGGYTRVKRVTQLRRGDAAEMASIELV